MPCQALPQFDCASVNDVRIEASYGLTVLEEYCR